MPAICRSKKNRLRKMKSFPKKRLKIITKILKKTLRTNKNSHSHRNQKKTRKINSKKSRMSKAKNQNFLSQHLSIQTNHQISPFSLKNNITPQKRMKKQFIRCPNNKNALRRNGQRSRIQFTQKN